MHLSGYMHMPFRHMIFSVKVEIYKDDFVGDGHIMCAYNYIDTHAYNNVGMYVSIAVMDVCYITRTRLSSCPPT